MKTKKLDSEFVSLVHHVELHQAGWWEKTIQKLIISIIWTSKKSLPFDALYHHLQDIYKIQITKSKVQNCIDELESKNSIMRLSKSEYKISEAYTKIIETDIIAYNNLESKVKNLLCSLIKEHCPTLNADEMWTKINDELLSPLIEEMGARTYELVSQSILKIDNILSFKSFLDQFPTEIHVNLRTVIVSFLSPSNSEVRSYAFGQLNSYFSEVIGNLDQKTVDSISRP